jgi:mannose-6-phosphate isomerase-like protein (cupin superfamily)
MIDRSAAPHYSWGDGCDGWHLVQQPALSIIEEWMPAGTAEVRHYHIKARQFFYVLSGQLTIEIDGKSEALRASQGLEVPPAAVHRVANDGAREARFLVVSAPPSHGDRVLA